MTNDVALKTAAETGLSFLAGGQNPFSKIAAEYGVTSGAFLKFSGNTGVYQYKGQNVEYGTVYAFNFTEMKRGWICWKENKAQEQHMVRALSSDRVKTEEELTDHGPYKEGEGWAEQVGVPLRDLAGGDQMDLNLSSKGGRGALLRISEEYGAKARFYLDEAESATAGYPVAKIPLVEIGAQSFQSPKVVGTKWAPTFKIVDWATSAELALISENSGVVDPAAAAQYEPAQAAPGSTPSVPPVPPTAPQPGSGGTQGEILPPQTKPPMQRPAFRPGARV